MNTLNKINGSSIFVLIVVLIIYSALIISSHHYERVTADFTIYFDIADKYVQGDYGNAINGYWGPLLSWLLIPFIYFGASQVFSVNALNLIIGMFTIAGVWILSYRYEMSDKIRTAVLVALLPIILFVSVVELFDFILLCLIVFYLGIIFKEEYPQSVRNGILCGVLGAFAYFTKSYAFPFFLIHFTFMNIAYYIRGETGTQKRKVLHNAVAGVVIFIIIASPWVFLISSKYGHFTISNMGKGNFAAHAPGLPQTGLEVGGPMFHKGFFPPSNETAISAWEDPSYIWKDIESWSPWESFSNFKYFMKNSLKNIFECFKIYESFSRLSFAIIVGYILLLTVRPFSMQVLRADLLYTFFTLILYTGGFIPFHFELRYLWTANILLLLMGASIVTLLFRSIFFNSNTRKNILLFFFVVSFIMTPLKSFVSAGKDNINKEMYIISTMLKDKFNIQGNIASNREWEHIATHDSWHKTFRISHWLNSRYYGQEKKDISAEELDSELKKYNIDYYFFWGEPAPVPPLLSHYKEITHGEIPNLKIYNLKEE